MSLGGNRDLKWANDGKAIPYGSPQASSHKKARLRIRSPLCSTWSEANDDA